MRLRALREAKTVLDGEQRRGADVYLRRWRLERSARRHDDGE